MKRRVFTASVMHESHSFSREPATLDRFRAAGYHRGADVAAAYRDTRTELCAVFDVAQFCNWTLIPSVATHTGPCGPLTEETFERLAHEIIDDLKAALPVEGVMLVLHGAMVAEHIPDADGEIAARVRAVVGFKVPIAVSFDPHANPTRRLADTVNIVSSYRTVPHTDHYETGERAALLLDRAMSGKVRPVAVIARAPMMEGLDAGRTISGKGPMIDLLRLADGLKKSDPGILDISINAGFPWSDKAETGPSVIVTGDGHDPRFQLVADQLIGEAWRQRTVKTIEILPIADAIARVKTQGNVAKPILLGDITDNPGGGASGDNTNLLRAMVAADLQNAAFAAITDPAEAQRAIAAGVGATVALSIGGKVDPVFSGTPLEITGEVIAVSDGVYRRKGPFATGTTGSFGPSAAIQVGGLAIVVASNAIQIDDREQFRLFGIDPEKMAILGCKAMNHFRADFEPIARGLVYADGGGICTYDFGMFPWKHLRRPVWPLDDVAYEARK